MSLVGKLKERQGNKSQMEFAAELGVNQAALSRIYRGERAIGARVAKKIAKRFPELTFEVASFLLDDNMTPEHNQRTA